MGVLFSIYFSSEWAVVQGMPVLQEHHPLLQLKLRPPLEVPRRLLWEVKLSWNTSMLDTDVDPPSSSALPMPRSTGRRMESHLLSGQPRRVLERLESSELCQSSITMDKSTI